MHLIVTDKRVVVSPPLASCQSCQRGEPKALPLMRLTEVDGAAAPASGVDVKELERLLVQAEGVLGEQIALDLLPSLMRIESLLVEANTVVQTLEPYHSPHGTTPQAAVGLLASTLQPDSGSQPSKTLPAALVPLLAPVGTLEDNMLQHHQKLIEVDAAAMAEAGRFAVTKAAGRRPSTAVIATVIPGPSDEHDTFHFVAHPPTASDSFNSHSTSWDDYFDADAWGEVIANESNSKLVRLRIGSLYQLAEEKRVALVTIQATRPDPVTFTVDPTSAGATAAGAATADVSGSSSLHYGTPRRSRGVSFTHERSTGAMRPESTVADAHTQTPTHYQNGSAHSAATEVHMAGGAASSIHAAEETSVVAVARCVLSPNPGGGTFVRVDLSGRAVYTLGAAGQTLSATFLPSRDDSPPPSSPPLLSSRSQASSPSSPLLDNLKSGLSRLVGPGGFPGRLPPMPGDAGTGSGGSGSVAGGSGTISTHMPPTPWWLLAGSSMMGCRAARRDGKPEPVARIQHLHLPTRALEAPAAAAPSSALLPRPPSIAPPQASSSPAASSSLHHGTPRRSRGDGFAYDRPTGAISNRGGGAGSPGSSPSVFGGLGAFGTPLIAGLMERYQPLLQQMRNMRARQPDFTRK